LNELILRRKECLGSFCTGRKRRLTLNPIQNPILSNIDYTVTPDTYDNVEVAKGSPLVLSCKAKFPVEFVVEGGAKDDRIRIMEEFHPDAFYNHVSTLTFAGLDEIDSSRILCMRKGYGEVLHSWNYQVVGKLIE
jgi:hypothetical protein